MTTRSFAAATRRKARPSSFGLVFIALIAVGFSDLVRAAIPFRASVTLNGLVQAYDGAAKPVTATTDPPGLPVLISYDGAALAPSNSGSYTVMGVITDSRFHGSAKDTLTITPAVTNLVLPAPAVYAAGQRLDFELFYSGQLFISTNNGTPALPLFIGTNQVEAKLDFAASGGNILAFDYVVQVDDEGPVSLAAEWEFHGADVLDTGGNPVASDISDALLPLDGVSVGNVAPPPPTIVLQLQTLGVNTVRIVLRGQTNAVHVIEASDNLSSPNWRVIGSVETDAEGNGSLDASSDSSAQFFRAWSQTGSGGGR